MSDAEYVFLECPQCGGYGVRDNGMNCTNCGEWGRRFGLKGWCDW